MSNNGKKTSNAIKYTLATILSIVLFVFTTFQGAYAILGTHTGKLVTVFFLYFLLTTYIQLRHRSDRYILLFILLFPPLALHGGVLLVEGYYPALSIPSTLAYFVGTFLGWIIAYQSKKIQSVTFAFSIVIVGWMYFRGYDLYLHYLNYGNLYGSMTPIHVSKNIIYKNEQSKTVTFPNDHSLIVLDVWNNGCGICYREFPKLEKLYKNYANRNDVKFYALNVALREDDIAKAKEITLAWDYTFPNLFLERKEYAGALGIQSYPTVLIIKNDSIVFKGDIDNVERVITKYNATSF